MFKTVKNEYTSALCEMHYYSGDTVEKDVFKRRTSTGSEAFSLFIYLDANEFVLLIVFCLPESFNQSLPNDAKSPLPVDFSRLKTLLLKLPNEKLKPKRFKATDVKQK